MHVYCNSNHCKYNNNIKDVCHYKYGFIVGITRYYYVCCRDGDYRGHKSCSEPSKNRPHQKISRKMSGTCISRMYVDLHVSKRVTVRYIPTHTGHKPAYNELKFLPLPESTKDEVSLKLAQGISSKRVLQGGNVLECIHVHLTLLGRVMGLHIIYLIVV